MNWKKRLSSIDDENATFRKCSFEHESSNDLNSFLHYLSWKQISTEIIGYYKNQERQSLYLTRQRLTRVNSTFSKKITKAFNSEVKYFSQNYV